jgi:nicotinamidase-related amidase
MDALLVIDMQNGVVLDAAPRFEINKVIGRINTLIAEFRKRGLVLFVQHTDEREGLDRGTQAWAIVSALDRLVSDPVVEKRACDSFHGTCLEETLKARGVKRLFIAGCCTDFCLDSTVRAAPSHGFEVCVVADAHTTADRPHLDAKTIITHHNYVWANLIIPQGTVQVLTTEEVLEKRKEVKS